MKLSITKNSIQTPSYYAILKPMSKISLRKLFKLEYILIFFSFLTCVTTELFKHNTLESFTKIDRDIRELQILYNDTNKSSAYKEELSAELMEECLPFIYFSTESKHKLIRILELFKYDAVSWNTNHQNSKYFINLVANFYGDIKETQRSILFGFDSMLFCSVFILFLATIMLLTKRAENQTSLEDLPYQEKAKTLPSPKEIIIFALITIFAIAFNIASSILPRHISVPMYMDSTFTIAVTALCGLTCGTICAIFTNLILFLTNYTSIRFVLCHILTAVLAAITFRHHQRRTKIKRLNFEIFLWAGVWIAISNAILGDFLASHLFDSSSASPILDGSVLGLYVVFKNLTVATYISGLFTNIADKLLSASISYIFYILLARKFKNIFK